VISKDITERKLTEEALQESEKKFRFLAENMVDIIWIVDQDFQTTYVSPSIEKTLGFTPEERKRQFLEEMITPKSLQKVQAKFIEELQRDEEGTVDPDRSVIIEVEYYHKEGYTVWMENVVKALRGPGGAIIGMHGVSRDINKRKQAEEALQESEIKHKTLVHNIPGMVYRAYTDWSAEIISGSREICGYTNEELNSQEESWLSIIYPDDKEKVFKEGLELTKRQQDAVQTYRIATKDGNIRWIEDRKSSLFSGEGEFKWIDGIAFDITARKQAEEALKEREVELARKNLRLEELNSALKVLLEKRNQDKTELEENVLTNMKELVLPYVEKLKRAGLSDKQEVFADILQSNLEDIVSPFARKLKSKYLGFTPTELKVSNLVRQGLSTKEIADLLNSSPETISGHRKSIRKKLKLTDKKSNLRTHLISLNNGRI
jgi:PAS domain S-box-containing protein